MPFSRIRCRSRPAPSSRNSTPTSLPSWVSDTMMEPMGSLPAPADLRDHVREPSDSVELQRTEDRGHRLRTFPPQPTLCSALDLVVAVLAAQALHFACQAPLPPLVLPGSQVHSSVLDIFG